MKRQRAVAPWDSTKSTARYTVMPWSVRRDSGLTIVDRAVYETMAAEAFVRGCNIVKVSNSSIARWTGVSVRSVVDSMRRLVAGSHLESMEDVRRGKTMALKLTAEQFASKRVEIVNRDGAHLVARENIEAFREKERAGMRERVRAVGA